MNVTQYTGSSIADTSRCPSPSIWADCPSVEIDSGIKSGVHLFDDFVKSPKIVAGADGNSGDWVAFASTNATGVDGADWGGSLEVTGTTDNEGIGIRTGSAPFKIARAQGKFWFEARVKTSTIADTKHGIFVGLKQSGAITAISPITATGTIADINIVGFHRLEGDGDYFDTVYKADGVTQVTVGSDAVAVVADTWVKLGMVFNPSNNVLTFYNNGVKLDDSYTVVAAEGTDFPNDVLLGPIMSIVLATGTSPGSSSIDWVRAAQLAV